MADFVRQAEKPLFPDVLWNRPVNKSRGGRLLIAGGHRHEFSQVQNVYQIAGAAGIGYCQAAMPDTIKRFVGAEFGHFLPSTASGSIGRSALAELLDLVDDHDGTILGVNLTNNSETAMLVESLLNKTDKPVIITEETINILKFNPALITKNPNAVVVATMAGLFALANSHNIPIAIKPNSGVVGKIEVLKQLVAISRCGYLVFDEEIMVAAEGEVSLTTLNQPLTNWPPVPIGITAALLIQNRSKPFQVLTTAAFIASQAVEDGEKLTSGSLAKNVHRALLKYEGR